MHTHVHPQLTTSVTLRPKDVNFNETNTANPHSSEFIGASIELQSY